MMTTIKKDLGEVHFLRGLASLMVCLFHLILGNENLFPSSNLLEQTFSFGYLGVEVFFILSGYVICYALPNNFRYQDIKTFILKRFVRIEPPYIASIFLILVLNYLSHKISGLPNDFDFLVALSHLAYINNFIPGSYYNVVYWTLGIEFQFYFLLSLLFPILQHSRHILIVAAISFVALACISIPYNIQIIVPFLSYFTLGILLFFYKIKKQIQLELYLPLTIACFCQLYFFQGPAGLITAILTVLALQFWSYTNRYIRFFSTISYSLYLIHVPIGGKVINLGIRYTDSNLSKYLLLVLALVTSIGFAYIFYRLIELPAIHYSKKILYKADQDKKRGALHRKNSILKFKRLIVKPTLGLKK